MSPGHLVKRKARREVRRRAAPTTPPLDESGFARGQPYGKGLTLKELDGTFLKIEPDGKSWRHVEFTEADGIMFLCPPATPGTTGTSGPTRSSAGGLTCR